LLKLHYLPCMRMSKSVP